MNAKCLSCIATVTKIACSGTKTPIKKCKFHPKQF